MINIRKSSDRGYADHGWLQSHHSFSFADYYDPAEMGWGTLRVINEDVVAPGAGFDTHGHRDMEIITYVMTGELEHRDSMGNGEIIHAGDVQRMSAGTGVQHSEFNPSSQNPVHLLQIWIQPAHSGIRPEYEQRHFSQDQKRGGLCLLASPDGRDGSITIHQDAYLYASRSAAGSELFHRFSDGRMGYLHTVKGALRANGAPLQTGDALKIRDVGTLTIEVEESAEFLLFDLGGVLAKPS
jgi:quercetin 2,3-dioxygenase